MKLFDAHYSSSKDPNAGLRELMEGIAAGVITVAEGDTFVIFRGFAGYEEYEAIEVSEDYTRVLWKCISIETINGDTIGWSWTMPMRPVQLEDLLYNWFDVRCTAEFIQHTLLMDVTKPIEDCLLLGGIWSELTDTLFQLHNPWWQNSSYNARVPQLGFRLYTGDMLISPTPYFSIE